MKQIFINCEHLETRVAIVEDGILVEYQIERNDERQTVGSVYKGRINNLSPSLQAAFIDIGLEKNAFSHYKDLVYYKTLIDGENAPIIQHEQLREDIVDSDGPEEEESNPRPQRKKRDRQRDNRGDSRGDNRRDNRGDNRRDNKRDNQQRDNRGNRRRNSSDRNEKSSGRGNDRNRKGRQNKNRRNRGKKKQTFLQWLISLFTGGNKKPSKPAPRQERRRGQQQQSDKGNRRQSNRPNKPRRRPRQQAPMIKPEDIPELLPEGADVIVQVEKGPIGTKGAKVTTKVEIPGHYLVLLPNSRTRGVSKRIEDREERQRLQEILKGLKLPKNMGCICRTAGMGKKARFFEMDVAMLLEQWNGMKAAMKKRAPVCIYQEPSLLDRSLREFLTSDVDEIICDSEIAYEHVIDMVNKLSKEERGKIRLYKGSEPIFQHYNLKQQVDNIFSRQVTLPSGGYICIDETEALIAIDINSGRSTKGKDHPETILSTNIEAAEEIARQVRLRNIGGLVVIDFIDMRSRKDQQVIYKTMQELLSQDRSRTKITPISRFGLMEMTRQREHESLQDTIFDPCPYCHGKGRVKSATSVSVEIQRRIRAITKKKNGPLSIRVICHPNVLSRLRHDDETFLSSMERKLGGQLSFRSDPSLHMEEVKIIDQRTGRMLR